MTKSKSHFLRFELIRDNYGNSWTYNINANNYVLTEEILKPGDLLVLSAIAYNPSSEQLFYNFKFGFNSEGTWQVEPNNTIKITEAHVSRSIAVYIRVSRKFKCTFIDLDENEIQFRYTVMQ